MSTSAARGWMYAVEATDRFLSYTFSSNLDVFLDFAFSNKAFVDNNRIKCPCLECDNKHFKTRNDVMFHLYEKGFTPNYTTWSAHGETSSKIKLEGEYNGPVEDDERTCLVADEVVPSNVDNTTDDETTTRIQHERECCSLIEDDECARMVVDEVVPSNVDNTTDDETTTRMVVDEVVPSNVDNTTDDETTTHMVVDEVVPSNADNTTDDETTTRIQRERECCSPIEDDGCTRMVVDEVGTPKVDNTTHESNCDSEFLDPEGCQKNLKVKINSKSKSKGNRRCQKDLKVNLTSKLFKSKSKGIRRCQKDPKVNPTSAELFKSKSKGTRRCQKDLKVNPASDELFKSKSKGIRQCQKDLKVNPASDELFNSKSKGTRRCQKDLKVNQTSDELFKSKSKNKIIKPVLPQNETKKIMTKKAVLNTQCVSTTDSRLSIFKHPGQKLFEDKRTYKYMYDAITIAHRYILFNCEEVKPFIRLFDDLTRQQQPSIDEGGFDTYRQNFAEWFRKHVHQGSNDISQDLKEIAQRPANLVWTYKGYSINGYKFHSQKHSERNVTKMNGVCVRGSVSNGHVHDYYGILDEIIEVEYYSKNGGSGGCVVVLFKCKWFDTPGGVGVKRKDNLVYIDPKTKLLTDNPFVLPSYAEQVFNAPHRSMSKELKDWWDLVKSLNEIKSQDNREYIRTRSKQAVWNKYHTGTMHLGVC